MKDISRQCLLIVISYMLLLFFGKLINSFNDNWNFLGAVLLTMLYYMILGLLLAVCFDHTQVKVSFSKKYFILILILIAAIAFLLFSPLIDRTSYPQEFSKFLSLMLGINIMKCFFGLH